MRAWAPRVGEGRDGPGVGESEGGGLGPKMGGLGPLNGGGGGRNGVFWGGKDPKLVFWGSNWG